MAHKLASLIVFILAAAACSTEVGGLKNMNGDGGGGTGGVTDDAGTNPGNADSGLGMRSDAARGCEAGSPMGRAPNGATCTCSSECGSGFCVDGMCCNSACTGTCQACNIRSSPGTCSPIPAGTRPVLVGQCKTDAVSSCGFDGTCDGAGACRKYPDGTVCTPGRCTGPTVTGTMVCSAGACKAGPSTTCTPFACDALGTPPKCFSACTLDSQCDGRRCVAGSCGKKPLGAVCRATAECESGFCADGVCCNLACTGACVSCSQVGKMGECSPVAKDTADPHALCRKDAADTCGGSGLCNGAGGCAKYNPGTVCKPASCSGGSQIPASVCNGLGTCLLGSPINCFPYACLGDSCKSGCSAATDCAAGRVCNAGSCGLKGNGQKCMARAECSSGVCVDGVCCNKACAGSCTYCAFPSALGRCVNVPAGVPDPRLACQDQGAAMCKNNGRCNGTGACQTYATGTVCKAETCDAGMNKYTQEGVCKTGVCSIPAAASCSPNKCNGTSCGTTCSTNDQCVAPNQCLDGSCGKKPNGGLCAMGNECVSGFCAQGVCCGSACTSSCFSCNQAGSAGQCLPIPAGGSDPAGMCRDQGATSCGSDGTCNGMGACRKYATGTVCGAASCAAGAATSEATCDGNGTCRPGAQSQCNPFVCNTGGTACFSSCTGNSQCVPTRMCEMGTCGKKDNGGTCAGGDECKSGFCVDGFCCNNQCTGVCKSCALPGAARGTCSNIPASMADDEGGCDATAESTCGNDGFCNGSGACRKWSNSTICRPASCPLNMTTLTQAAKCDGAGACPAGAAQTCGTYRCDSTTNMCKMTCTSDADCAPGKACSGGSCGKNTLGASCTGDSECASDHCVDNTCCNVTACGECQTCANAAGLCTNVPNDMPDPDSCTDRTTADACSTIGKCDGASKCKFAASGTGCGSMCSGSDNGSVTGKTCSGSGACSGTGGVTACGGFQCSMSASGGSCLNTCDPATNAGCVAGKVCTGNTCQDPAPPTPDAGADM